MASKTCRLFMAHKFRVSLIICNLLSPWHEPTSMVSSSKYLWSVRMAPKYTMIPPWWVLTQAHSIHVLWAFTNRCIATTRKEIATGTAHLLASTSLILVQLQLLSTSGCYLPTLTTIRSSHPSSGKLLEVVTHHPTWWVSNSKEFTSWLTHSKYTQL